MLRERACTATTVRLRALRVLGETQREWERINEQDAALFIVAGCTGLRLGELLALRWSDVDLKAGILTVSRAMSAGEESSTKSRRSRSVPLADRAASELKALRKRRSFRARTERYLHSKPRPDDVAKLTSIFG